MLNIKCKYQLKQKTKTRGNNDAANKNCILRKMDLKFQNLKFKTLCKIHFWNKQKWLNKEVIISGGLLW